MKYANYLKSEHWKKVRTNHLQKKKNMTCAICSSQGSINVYHRFYYRKRYGHIIHNENISPSVLISLCNDCHGLWHKHQGKTILKNKYISRIHILLNFGISKEDAIRFCSGREYTQVLLKLSTSADQRSKSNNHMTIKNSGAGAVGLTLKRNQGLVEHNKIRWRFA